MNLVHVIYYSFLTGSCDQNEGLGCVLKVRQGRRRGPDNNLVPRIQKVEICINPLTSYASRKFARKTKTPYFLFAL